MYKTLALSPPFPLSCLSFDLQGVRSFLHPFLSDVLEEVGFPWGFAAGQSQSFRLKVALEHCLCNSALIPDSAFPFLPLC